MNRRILYIQYTNPAGYPPLEHSSRILADGAWEVLFLGTGARGADALTFPLHPNIRVLRWKFCPPGVRQKLHYTAFCLWCLWTALVWRPKWICASDPLSCPIALLLKIFGFCVLYHEHDSPSDPLPSRSALGCFQNFVFGCRLKLARRAELCVLPNEQRVALFRQQTGRTAQTLCVWNCPRRNEISRSTIRLGSVMLHYHGNISPDLLPEILVFALKEVPDVTLRAIGYTTAGNESYPVKLRQLAESHGIANRVVIEGPMQRADLLAEAAKATAGWCAMPTGSRNSNFVNMAGASNKAFDYMACGLALLVSDLPDWRRMFVEPGYARACDPDNVESIASVLRSLVQNPADATAMGERGRERIETQWNYETQFQQVEMILNEKTA